MTTLRAFVEGILDGETGQAAVVRSKPDRLSESYELRRLVADGTRKRPPTDCYEFYWAHHMEGNRVGHLWPLARLLYLRWPWRVPPCLLPLWLLSWALAMATAWAWTNVDLGGVDRLRLSHPVWWALGALALVIAQLFATRYLGDAARYLSPTPQNVGIRQKIRAEGVRIVRSIQETRRYDRIIIVGHSLGSVIGYDIVTHLWDEYNTKHNRPERPSQAALKKLQEAGRALTPDPEALRSYRAAQRALWREQRGLGNPWLVTDFITVGSPLTYGALLFAGNDKEFRRRQEDRELPTCPPATDDGKYFHRPRKPYLVNGKPRTLFVLHHAAPFAVTCWTNIYVPLTFGLFGDWVGGPLQRWFGCGIADVPVRDAPNHLLPLIGHTRYWRPRSVASLSALRDALSLNSREWLPASVDENTEPDDAGGPLRVMPPTVEGV